MVRELLVPTNQQINISIPASYVGKMIEIIAFKVDEEKEEKTAKPESTKEELLKIYEKYRFDLTTYKFDRDEANER